MGKLKLFDDATIQTVNAYKQHLLKACDKFIESGALEPEVKTQIANLKLYHCTLDAEQLVESSEHFNLQDTLDALTKEESNIQMAALNEIKNIQSAFEAFERQLNNLYGWTQAKVDAHNALALFIGKIAEEVYKDNISCEQLKDSNPYGVIVLDNRIFINFFDEHTIQMRWPDINSYADSNEQDAYVGMEVIVENNRRNAVYAATANNLFKPDTDEWKAVSTAYIFLERLFANKSWCSLLKKWRLECYRLDKLRSTCYTTFRAMLRTFNRVMCEKTLNHVTWCIDHDCQKLVPNVVETVFTDDKQHQFDGHVMKIADCPGDNYLDQLARFLFRGEYLSTHPNSKLLEQPKFD